MLLTRARGRVIPGRRKRRLALTATLLAVLFSAPALPAVAEGSAPPDGSLASAQQQAADQGQPVPVDALTTETYSITANPDGSFTSTTSVLPVRVRQNGGWTPVDATLTANTDGTFSPRATPNGVTLSGGGNGPLVTLAHQDGTSMSLSVPFDLPAPEVSGDSALYSSVLPGVDLSVSVTDQGGFSDVLIVHDAAAAADPDIQRLTLAASTDGLTLAATDSGGMTATATDGSLAYTTPRPLMWDSSAVAAAPSAQARTLSSVLDEDGPVSDAGSVSSSVDGPGPDAQVSPVPMTTSSDGLTLTPDSSVFSNPDTTYPVYIDPSAEPSNPITEKSGHYDEVYSNPACSDSPQYDKPQTNGEGVGYQGYGGKCGSGIERSYYSVDTSDLTSDMVISNAAFDAETTYATSYDCSHNQPITFETATRGIDSDTDWTNKPPVDPNYDSVTTHVASGPNPNSSCSKSDAKFTLSKTERDDLPNKNTWTFILKGDETSGDPDSNYLRVSSKVTLEVTFDINPDVPTKLKMTPTPLGADAACTTDGVGWIGATTYSDAGSNVKLYATVSSNVSGETVQAEYYVWDRSVEDSDGVGIGKSSPESALTSSGNTTTESIGFTLKDGHEYGWDVYAKDKAGLTSDKSDHCYFRTDFTPPQSPTVAPNASFPAAGGGDAPNPVVYASADGTTTFQVTAKDNPASDDSCTPDACLSSGIDHFLWRLDSQPTATTGTTAKVSGTDKDGLSTGAISVPITNWGIHTLYVAAVDNAGNISQSPAAYTFTVPWNPATVVTPGDVSGDGVPDLLTTTKSGDLEMVPGGTDAAQQPAPAETGPVSTAPPVTGPEIVATAAESYDGDGWNNYLIAHRGNLSGGNADDLYVYDKASGKLYLDKNDLDPSDGDPHYSGAAGFIGRRFDELTKPGCWAEDKLSDDSRCRAATAGYDASDWNVSQMVAPGDLFGSGSSDLITVENKQLWLYTSVGDVLGDPILLGTGDWTGKTLLAPGQVNGVPTLWARDNTTGALSSYSLQPDASGLPPVLTPSAGTSLGTTLTPSSYPWVASPGDVNSTTQADGAPDGCPDLYAVNAKGALLEYPGTCGASGSAGFGSAVSMGSVTDASVHRWPSADGSGSTVTDSRGSLDATLTGSYSWATDSSRGPVLQLNGTTGYGATSGPALDTSKSFTVSAWVKLAADDVNSTFVSESDTAGNANGFQLYYSSSHKAWAFDRHDDDSTSTSFSAVYGPKPTVGAWTHLAGVYDATSDQLSLYVNGQLAGAADYDGTTWNADGAVQLGRRLYQGSYGEYADGELSDVRVYDSALPVSDLVAMNSSPEVTGLS